MDAKERLDAIKEEISIEQVFQLLEVLDAEPQLSNGAIIARTICHGGDSHKLYYYENTKLFHCYTDCMPETFDIFQLIMKVKHMELPLTINYIIDFYNLFQFNENFSQNNEELIDWQILNKYNKNLSNIKQEEKKIEFKFYDDKILNYLPHPRIYDWEKEGITAAISNKYNIHYNPSNQAIVIPHYNINNKLIGIRERTLIKENEIYGKYRPMLLNKKLYNHPLSFNLYNLNNSKKAINQIKKVIIFEGEKSCLKYASYFGLENDISVACCGSNLSSYQVDLCIAAGAQEIIIAFDKQFQKIGDDEWIRWTNKLKNINNKFGSLINISFMFDKWDLLNYKDSPIDEDKEKFLELFKRRVII